MRKCVSIGCSFSLFAILTGCQAFSQTPPVDPLLVSRRPIEAEAVSTPPLALAYSEPTAPLHPEAAMFAASKPDAKRTPGHLTSNPRDH